MKRTSVILSVAAASCLMMAASVFADQPQPQRNRNIVSHTCGTNGCSSHESAAAPAACTTGQCSHPHAATRRSAPLSNGVSSFRGQASLPSMQPSPKVMWQRDLRKAAQLARDEGKPIMVSVSAAWCHYCVKMKDETYSQGPIIDQINRQYVPVMLDADTNRNIVEMLGIESLPAIVVLSNDATVLSKTTGYKSAAELSRHLNQIAVANKTDRIEPATRHRR